MQAPRAVSIRTRSVRAACFSVAGVVLFAWGSKLAQPWSDIQAQGVDIPSFPPCSSMILQLAGLAIGLLAFALWFNVAFNSWRLWKRRGEDGDNAGQQGAAADDRPQAGDRV